MIFIHNHLLVNFIFFNISLQVHKPGNSKIVFRHISITSCQLAKSNIGAQFGEVNVWFNEPLILNQTVWIIYHKTETKNELYNVCRRILRITITFTKDITIAIIIIYSIINNNTIIIKGNNTIISNDNEQILCFDNGTIRAIFKQKQCEFHVPSSIQQIINTASIQKSLQTFDSDVFWLWFIQ